MRNIPFAAILALVAVVLALLAILDLVKGDVALGLAVICLGLGFLLPAAIGIGRNVDRT